MISPTDEERRSKILIESLVQRFRLVAYHFRAATPARTFEDFYWPFRLAFARNDEAVHISVFLHILNMFEANYNYVKATILFLQINNLFAHEGVRSTERTFLSERTLHLRFVAELHN